MTTTSDRQEPRARRDAVRNEALLVAAARELFAERGVDVPLEEVARRAGLGRGTLYRHFPTREALVEAIFAERIGELLALGEAALGNQDAWTAFVSFLETMLEVQSRDRVLREIFVRYPPGEGRLAEARQRIDDLFTRALARGHEQGVLRTDFGPSDLTLLLWSFAPVIDTTAETAPRVWRRHLHWLLDGLRPAAATPQTERPLDEAQLAAAMRCLREQRFPHRPRRRRSGF